MIKTKAKWMGFLMMALLTVSVPLVYADSGNGGNLSGGQLAVSANPSSSGQGQEDHEWKHGHGDHMEGRLFHKLNLTDDQEKQLKDIWQKQKESMKASFEQLKTNKEDLDKELLQPTPDMNKINALQTQLKTLQSQMMDDHLNSTLEVKKVLTPEQFGKYLELQKKMFADRFHKGDKDRDEDRHGHCDFRGECRHHHRHHHEHRNYQDDEDGE